MWWSMAYEMRAEFEDWHSHEHFPERMGIPGFLRGSRWASLGEGDEGFFVMYELETCATLTSVQYLARLNDPSPWSKKMMPHHRNMVRSQCRVVATYGGGIAQSMATTRLSPRRGAAQTLRDGLSDVLESLPGIPEITRRTPTSDADARTSHDVGTANPRWGRRRGRLDFARKCVRPQRASRCHVLAIYREVIGGPRRRT